MAVEILRYASFTDDPAAGNPAGVVIVDVMPSEPTMQRVAAEVGYSETAFAVPDDAHGDDDRSFVVRYFSPAAEVDFCGHATIALAVALGARGLTAARLSTNVGVVPVGIDGSSGSPVATLSAATAAMHPIDPGDRADLLRALRIDEDDLDPTLPVVVGDSGNLHPVVALSDRACLAALDHDDERLRELCVRHRWITIQVVCADGPRRWSARNPFPFGGVREDPATGSAAIALAACLRELALVPVPSVIVVEQGVDMGRRSVLTVAIDGPGAAVRVSGTAVRIT